MLLYQLDIYSPQSFYSIWYSFFLKYFLSLAYSIKHNSISFDSYYFPSFLYLDICKIMSLVLFFIHPPLWFLIPSLYKDPKLNLLSLPSIISSFVLVNAAVLSSSLSRNFGVILQRMTHSPHLVWLLLPLIFPSFVSFSLLLLVASRLSLEFLPSLPVYFSTAILVIHFNVEGALLPSGQNLTSL